MPITRSAKKALRVSKRKAGFNFKTRTAMKDAVKTVRTSVAKKADNTVEALRAAYKALDKAAKKGIIKKNAASRKKSRLAKLMKKMA